MIDLHFTVRDAEPIPFAAIPQLAFKLHLEEPAKERPTDIQSILLRCQIRIEPTKRHYDAGSQAGLRELFGERERWNQTQRHMLWTHTSTIVPTFAGQIDIDLPVPCSFDFNVAATKYFAALATGELPLLFLFSGTIFYVDEAGALHVMQISWECEASFRLPVATWRAMMDHHYPNSAWLRLGRDAFGRLAEFKSRHSLTTWDQALERLLTAAEEPTAAEATPS